MTCLEFRAHLHAYVDGELLVGETAAAEAHAAACGGCGALARGERELRSCCGGSRRRGRARSFGSGLRSGCGRRHGGRGCGRGWWGRGWRRGDDREVRGTSAGAAGSLLECPADAGSAPPGGR